MTNNVLNEDLLRAAEDEYITSCCDAFDNGIEWVDPDLIPDYTFDPGFSA